jgi:extracellular elastinolytic metalloproteinase
MSHPIRRVTVVVCALASAIVAIPAAASTVAPPASSARGGAKPFFDVRTTTAGGARARRLPADDRAARKTLVDALGRQAVLDADPITATPRALGRLNGTLTGAQAGDPADVAMGYVRDHADALGLSEADLATLEPSDRVKAGGITHLRWRQEYKGIPAFDNELRVNVDADGRVINVLGAPRHDLSVPSVSPRLSAAEALAALARDVGARQSARVTSGPTGARADTRFSTGDRARLVLFGDVSTVRLAWHLTYDAGPDAWYDAVVDATTGRVLRRANMVKEINARVFDQYPGAPNGGAQRTVSLDPFLTDTTRLFGNAAHAWSDLNDAVPPGATEETPNPGEDVVPGSYTFVDFTGIVNAAGACALTARCSWDHRNTRSWTANRQQNAVQAFYYVNHFHDHLAQPPINFTAASGAFEDVDRLNVETDDGANGPGGLPDANHQDNANMATPPDGQSPRMQMYLFLRDATPIPGGGVRSPFRDVNGGDDAAIVYHEYTHGLSNRLVTDADGAGALNSAQSGAMGEAWSDWYAKDLLAAEGFQVDTDAPGEVDMGAYTDSVRNSIRTQPLDCPVGSGPPACPGPVPPSLGTAGPGGYTYGDFGKISRRGAPEVHADGEIWAETLWDLRRRIGSEVSEQIVTEGMRLSPPEPSFLDMRNAILQADQGLRGGADVDGIWAVFANRGMGFFAGTEDGADVTPVEDFRPPPAAGGATGQITGRVVDSVTGAPLSGIVVGVGGLDTPPSSFVATTDANGNYSIGPVPEGTYPIVVFHPGAGYERFTARTVTVPGGGAATVDASLRRDWAALSGGATVAATNDNVFADFGCGVEAALDLSLGSGWSAYNAETPGVPGFPANPHQGAPPSATIQLPAAVDVTGFGVDPAETCGDDPSSATKDLRVEVSADGTTFTTVLEHTFVDADRGRVNVVAPTGAANGAKFVRVTMLNNQSGSAPGGAGQDFTDLSEFEVFGAATAAPAPTPTEAPAPDTPAPETPAPETPAPQTPAPETPAPETPAPETPAPDAPAPGSALRDRGR